MSNLRNRHIKILHVIGWMNRAGAETLLMHILRHINREAFQIDIAVHTTAPGAYDEEIRALGSRIFPCIEPSHPRIYARNLTQILQEHGPYDIVHSHVHHYSGFVLHIAYANGVEARVAHSHKGRSSASVANIPRRVYLNFAKRLIDRYATDGLAVSRSAAEDLFGANWESDARWRILRLGIDLSPFREPVDRAKAREELGIPENACVIGHVGRFSAEKNHSFLVDVAAEVARRKENTWLLLVGDGPLRTKIEKQVTTVKMQNRTLFAGTQNNTARLMRAIDVIVFPSLYEGLPLALVEAQAAGVPCVVSDVIGSEVDVLPSLVHRVSLRKPASLWADQAIAALESSYKISRNEALAAAESGPLNIANSIKDLERFYNEICRAR
jgi:glycosyltransferase involved in cell wall biosynthesis